MKSLRVSNIRPLLFLISESQDLVRAAGIYYLFHVFHCSALRQKLKQKRKQWKISPLKLTLERIYNDFVSLTTRNSAFLAK